MPNQYISRAILRGVELIDLRDVAHNATDAFGLAADARPLVTRFDQDLEGATVEIVECPDIPKVGLVSYATIGMSLFDNALEARNKSLRVELVAAAESGWNIIRNGLAGCAFNVASGEYQARPDVIFPGVMAGYDQSTTVPHGLLASPYPWSTIPDLETDLEIVTWLMLVPISEGEFAFASKNGIEGLKDLLEQTNANVFDLSRPSSA